MGLHLVKLCVGASCIEDLAAWQNTRLDESRRRGKPGRLAHTTYQMPKRTADLIDGGSIYWVIRGAILVRQRLVGFEEGTKSDGRRGCDILLDPALTPVRPTPRRAFQGWRYLDAAAAPPDIDGALATELADMPPGMRRDLTDLCLL